MFEGQGMKRVITWKFQSKQSQGTVSVSENIDFKPKKHYCYNNDKKFISPGRYYCSELEFMQ